MKIILEARQLRLYPVGKPGFRGGTEISVQKLADGLARRGHQVHVVTPDLEEEEQRGGVWWWPPSWFPREADAVVAFHNLASIGEYSADLLILASNGIDPWLGPSHEMADGVDAFACFSQTHVDLLCQMRPTVDRTRCFVTGLGVDLEDYLGKSEDKVPGRLLYASDPARGLWHLLDIFEHVRKDVPEATLHIAYDFERQFAARKWQSNALAELLWDCWKRVQTMAGVRSLGALSREDLIREQVECQVFAYPCDPPGRGSELFCLSAMEAAAAGAALVLSDHEALPEVYGEAATLLPVPGAYQPDLERRYDAQDWAEAVVEVMRDDGKWQDASRKARALAEQHTWERAVERFDQLLAVAGKRRQVEQALA